MNATARNCELLTLAALVLLAAAPVAADTYQVDRTDDTIHSQCDPGTYPDCSLRGAIIKANNHAGDDTVVLGSHTYTLSIFGRNEDQNQTGDLDVRDTLTIRGNGPEYTVIDGGDIDRVLHVIAAGGRLTVRGVTITGGDGGSQSGGGLFVSQGSLTLRSCIVGGNGTNSSGGGLYDAAGNISNPVEIVDSWFVVNSAQNGSALHTTSRLYMEHSTLSNNFANADSVAVIAGDGSILQNSTIALNAGSDVGGVTILAPSVQLWGCTLYDNDWGQLHAISHQPTLSNTLIVGECSSSTDVVTLGGNLESPGNTCGLGASDLVNVGNPMMGTLGLFGGGSPVIRPLPGSPVIDQSIATPNCPCYDQRGLWRPFDGGGPSTAVCDIGAVELVDAGEIFVEIFETGFTTSWTAVVP